MPSKAREIQRFEMRLFNVSGCNDQESQIAFCAWEADNGAADKKAVVTAVPGVVVVEVPSTPGGRNHQPKKDRELKAAEKHAVERVTAKRDLSERGVGLSRPAGPSR
jgi:hypothetical protein